MLSSGVRFPAGAKYFSSSSRQSGSGVHLAVYQTATRNSFPGIKQPERKADHLPPYGGGFKNVWSYTSTSSDVYAIKCNNDFTSSYTLLLQSSVHNTDPWLSFIPDANLLFPYTDKNGRTEESQLN
jgi:hypothetical protein